MTAKKDKEKPSSYLISGLMFLGAGIIWGLNNDFDNFDWMELVPSLLFILCSLISFYQYSQLKN